MYINPKNKFKQLDQQLFVNTTVTSPAAVVSWQFARCDDGLDTSETAHDGR